MEHLNTMEHFYTEESPEEMRLAEGSAQYLEFETACRLLARFLPAKSRVLDSCAGTGVYAFHLVEQGHSVVAGDFVQRNVSLMKQAQAGRLPLAEILALDARDLSRFEDGSFDAVLCMGALYHLHTEADRRRVVAEGLRALRGGGLFFATYMNRYAVIQNNARGDLANLGEIMRYLADGEEGVFYASTPEETEGLMADFGLTKRCHASLDGIANFLHTTAGLIDKTGLARWGEYHAATCEVPSLLGSGYHNLYIGQK